MSNMKGVRWRYARKLRRKAALHSKLLIRAFAEVPREHYLGAGPWPLLTMKGYRRSRTAHPRVLYDDILVGIVPKRFLNNGQPSGLASWFDALDLKRNDTVVHVGCGTGYYTAILAHVVGPRGHVRAIEIDRELVPRAKENLGHLPNVEVVEGDGSKIDPGPADAIFVNAGANYPVATWLDALKPGGRLLFPLITARLATIPIFRHGKRVAGFYRAGMSGVMILVRREDAKFSARAISSVGIFPCIGAIERDADRNAAAAIERGDVENIRSIRRDAHAADASCWLHTDGACISTAPLD
ncbi:MAG TPA: methyltransferase domain-containing protein [Candidatus Acidoferrales bacterium]|nr:methyltransferase domain-containing protein [Candidatus Acidoferrales bacterium]